MKPKETAVMDENHSIEWGEATWTKDEPDDKKDFSIRNRYSNAQGGFNYAGSSELPWFDFNLMIIESIKRDQFSKHELGAILIAISHSLIK